MARREHLPTFTHFLDLPLLCVIVALGAMRPNHLGALSGWNGARGRCCNGPHRCDSTDVPLRRSPQSMIRRSRWPRTERRPPPELISHFLTGFLEGLGAKATRGEQYVSLPRYWPSLVCVEELRREKSTWPRCERVLLRLVCSPAPALHSESHRIGSSAASINLHARSRPLSRDHAYHGRRDVRPRGPYNELERVARAVVHHLKSDSQDGQSRPGVRASRA